MICPALSYPTNAERNPMTRPQTKPSSPRPTPVSKISLPMPETSTTLLPWQRSGFESGAATPKPKTTFEGGQGLLCNTVWGAPLDREVAAQKERDRQREERHQSLKRMLRNIDECFARSPFLNEKLLAAATAKMSPAAERTFLKFKLFTETWGLPFLPETVPQAIALFVLEYAANAREAERIVKHLAEAYDKLSPRPWRDPLVSVMLETMKNEPAETT